MSNADKFLRSFSVLEKALRERGDFARSVPLYHVIDRLAEQHAYVRHYRNDLKEFADLRNAIVHERTDEHILAEPNDRAVADIERLEQLMLSPPKLLPTFQRDVQTVAADQPVTAALEMIVRQGFSQVPVFEGDRVIGLVNGTTLVKWLGVRAPDDLVSLFETTVAEVLRHTKDANYRIVARDTPLFEVVDAFREFETQGRLVDAILINHDGRETSTLLGIVTIHDVPRLIREISIMPGR